MLWEIPWEEAPEVAVGAAARGWGRIEARLDKKVLERESRKGGRRDRTKL